MVRDEVGHRHHPRQNERDGPREQTDKQKQAAGKFKHAGRADQREQV